jgi:hypothetical protein
MSMRPAAKYAVTRAVAVPLLVAQLPRIWVQHLEPQMKLLIGLSIAQLGVLIVVAAMMTNDRTKEFRGVSDDARVDVIRSEQAPSAKQVPSFDEQRLRTIVREELASQNPASARTPVVAPVIPDAATAAKFTEQQQHVSQRIASLKHTGPIPDQQMQDLLSEIEQLDEQGRKQSLSMLAQAINTGAIKGRL